MHIGARIVNTKDGEKIKVSISDSRDLSRPVMNWDFLDLEKAKNYAMNVANIYKWSYSGVIAQTNNK